MSVLSQIKKIGQVAVATALLSSCDRSSSDPSRESLPSVGELTETVDSQSKNVALHKFDPRKIQVFEVVKAESLGEIAERTSECPADNIRTYALNGISPSTRLLPGTCFRTIPKDCGVPNLESDKGVDPSPLVVKMQKGQTLWEYSRNFKVPLDLLIAINCEEGESQVTRLKEGREIVIPMFQTLSIEGKRSLSLEGLLFDDPMQCEAIATRMIKCDRGHSQRRAHLSAAMQHLSPVDRKIVVGQLCDALERVGIKEHLAGNSTSDLAVMSRPYAEALRACVNRFGIDNPFRLSPIALLDIVDKREKLAAGDLSGFTDKVAIIIAPDGDSNGAFKSFNLITEKAMSDGVSVLYFQVGSCSDAIQNGNEVKKLLSRGVDYLFVGGHGRKITGSVGAGLVFSYSSTRDRAEANRDFARLGDLELNGKWSDQNKFQGLVSLVRPGGDLAFISCYSGEDEQKGNNLVRAMAMTASKQGTRLKVIGSTTATNVKSVEFAESGLEVIYWEGKTFELNSAPLPKKHKM